MKHISILGSTGSIGTQTLEIVRESKNITVDALSAGNNIKLLEEQIREFNPKLAVVWDEKLAGNLKQSIKDTSCKVLSGMEGLIELATYETTQILVTAIVGMIGIEPTIAAILSGKDIALANKETLICAGHIIMPLAKEMGVDILPVDSEHSAIFQCLQGNSRNDIHKLILTASGGPFRGYSLEMLKNVSLEDALKHPNWSMGKKITIDSSTMVNKGLEVMEARWLFDVDIDDIQVIIQPKSIIHSMVEYKDGAVMAQLGIPDMKLPIQYALFYPDRLNIKADRLDFTKIKSLEFEVPDMKVFKALKLAYKAGKMGGIIPTVYNAANEFAVARFLEKRIGYLDIVEMIEKAMSEHKNLENPTVEDILEARACTEDFLKSSFQLN